MQCDFVVLLSEVHKTNELSKDELYAKRQDLQNTFNYLMYEVEHLEDCEDIESSSIEKCLINAEGFCGGYFQDELSLREAAKNINGMKSCNTLYANRIV